MIYQATVAQKVDTLTTYLAWGQSFGAALSSFGWSPQTGHGENIATGSGATYAWSNVAAAPTTCLQAMSAYTFRGAWVSGTTYVGSNTANGTADLVTSGGLTYVHITSTSSLSTAPGSDTTNWQPFIYEIWKSNGSNSSALPIYIRLVYTRGTNAVPIPIWHLTIGTGVDSNGNLTNTVVLTGNAPTNTIVVGVATGTAGVATGADMDFSGDADNFRMLSLRGATVAGLNSMFLVERAKTAAGQDSDAFVYIGSCMTNINNTTTSRSAVILKAALGGTIIGQSASGWCGAISNGFNVATSLLTFGSTPPFPVFPMVGFCANPLLGCVGFNRGDVTDGNITAVWLYGQSHNYLICSSSSVAGMALNNLATTGVIPAILWE
jgi:hypothetical protein